MGIFRLLALVIGIFIVYLLLKRYFGSLQQPARPPRPRNSSQGEDMVRCVVCGVNTPRSEAIFSGGEYFCCPEHRQSRRN
jgi:uncharacterized protein